MKKIITLMLLVFGISLISAGLGEAVLDRNVESDYKTIFDEDNLTFRQVNEEADGFAWTWLIVSDGARFPSDNISITNLSRNEIDTLLKEDWDAMLESYGYYHNLSKQPKPNVTRTGEGDVIVEEKGGGIFR